MTHCKVKASLPIIQFSLSLATVGQSGIQSSLHIQLTALSPWWYATVELCAVILAQRSSDMWQMWPTQTHLSFAVFFMKSWWFH